MVGCIGGVCVTTLVAGVLGAIVRARDAVPAGVEVPPGSRRPDAQWYGTAPLSLELPSSAQELSFFAHGSCADQRKPQRFWSTLLRTAPQLFLFNGDLVYGDCTNVSSCPALPAAWRALFHNPHFRAAAERLPMTGILDDHDYGANDCHAGLEKFDSWKSFAKHLFLERFGVRTDDERRLRGGLYTAMSFGPLGRRTQIILLDTRWFRSPFLRSPCQGCPGRERYTSYNGTASAQHTMLGEAQWQWLEAVLREPAELRLVVSTVQVLATGHGCAALNRLDPSRAASSGRAAPRLPSPCLLCAHVCHACARHARTRHARALLALVAADPEAVRSNGCSGARVLAGEHWGLIPTEAARLLSTIAHTGARGVVLLSGDRHTGGIYRVRRGERAFGAPPLPYDLVEITSSSLTHSYRTAHDETGVARVGNLTHENNFGTVAVDWARRTVTLDLRASDDCGLSAQAWGHLCEAPGSGVAGAVLMNVTLHLDALSP